MPRRKASCGKGFGKAATEARNGMQAEQEQMETARMAAAQAFIGALPHARALGMRIEEIGAGMAVISMPWDERLVGDPATGVIHGGAVSALMDTSGGAAALCHPEAPMSTATLDLRIDYMRPAQPGQRIVAQAECWHMTRSVAFIRAIAHDGDEGRPVASANGAYTLERGK